MLQRNRKGFLMATVWNDTAHAATTKRGSTIFSRLAQIGAWVGERRARTQALRELERMDERDLRDLRISPYDFNDIANGTYRR